MIRKLLIAVCTILILFICLVYIGNRYVNDQTIPIIELATAKDRVLFVFAHPDDEITVAGTLAALNANDVATGLVYLTHGEKGPTGGLVSQHQLGVERAREAHTVKTVLGIDYLKIMDFPDSNIKGVEPDSIKQSLLKCFNEFKPTIAIGFDKTVGLYGHEDHRLAGLYVHQILRQLNYVQQYYMVTLPDPLINLALKISDAFKNNYPKEKGQGLPLANVAVNIWKFGPAKRKVLEAHKTQWQVINDVQPFGMAVNPYLYYKIFDREYYHRVF